MPKGANPAGKVASVKPPEGVTRAKFLSSTTMRLLWKSAAYRKLAVPLLAMASPLKTAPPAALSYASLACVPSTVGAHPEMVPDSVAKRNRDAAVTVPLV
jgi:hypothetical protein